jgi:nitroreductase/Pyruvate/2-oxoacid:ferredoxin oxidoreductase delta subunit
MGLLIVDEGKCKRDGLCAADCPVGIIAMPEGGFPQVLEGAETFCIACGHCVAVCPHGAMSHPMVKVQECLPIGKELRLSPEQVEQFMRSRRSMRQYRPEPVPQAELERLLNLARFAPTGHNSQSVTWKVYTRPEDVRTLASHVVDWMRRLVEKGEPAALELNMALICDFFDKGVDFILRGAPHLVLTHAHQEDRAAPHACDMAMAYVELYAPVLGLGTCWAGYFEQAARFWRPLQAYLALPAGHQVMNAAMVGYPKATYYRCPERKALQVQWV